MQTYETLFITSPTLTEDVERTTVDSLSQVVTDGGGTMVANERMGRRRLAYPIQKHTDGVYVRFLYDSEAAVPKELERRIRLSDNVLRVLTVRLDQKWAVAAKEQAVRDAQARAEAAERERVEREEAEKRAREEAAAAAAAAESAEDVEAAEGAEAPAEAAPAEPAGADAAAAPTGEAGEPEQGA
jgi:small subunit ribosomal protein S6